MAHATVELQRHGHKVAIDVGIAPLIEVLWRRGIETVSSCENTATSAYDAGLPDGSAYVTFADAHDARRFARTCRGGRAFDASVILLAPVQQRELAGADDFGIQAGATSVVFAAASVADVTARLAALPVR